MNSAAPEIIALPGLGRLQKTARHILLLGEAPWLATGSCVWNGGSAHVSGWLNLKVGGDTNISESPAQTLQAYAATLGIHTPLAGMMTAASMNSLRHAVLGDAATHIACIVTAGIQNARRAGDSADGNPLPGTLNIALVSNRFFTPAACIEALMLATEAKTAACYDLGITSPVSQQIATGTGTDSICLLSATTLPSGTCPVEYCGKHTRIGEWIGAATYHVMRDAMLACLAANPPRQLRRPGDTPDIV